MNPITKVIVSNSASFLSTKDQKFIGRFKSLKRPKGHLNHYLRLGYECYKIPQILIKSPGCNISTFKKKLYNSVKMIDGRFIPNYNRRKHNHSHALTVTHHQKQFSKTFGYVNRNKIEFLAGLSLKLSHGKGSTHKQDLLRSKTTLNFLMETIETEAQTLLHRNIWVYGPYESKQKLLHKKKRAISIGSVLSHAYYHGLNITSTYIGVNMLHTWLQHGEAYRSY